LTMSLSGFIYLLSLMESMMTVESVAMITSIPVIRQSVNLSQDLHVSSAAYLFAN